MRISPWLRSLLLLAATGCLPLHAATFTVNSASDSGAATDCPGGGHCTLRAALVAANATAAADTIRFELATGAVIAPLAPLPTASAQVLVDARPTPEHAGRPTVFLDGTAAGAGADGLRFGNGAAGSAVYGLGFARWDGTGIVLTGNAHLVSIRGCEFGLSNTGSVAGNGAGIVVGTDSNSIGQVYIAGTGFVGAGNAIFASEGDGIGITGDGNLVYGNTLGGTTTATGNRVGIRVFSGSGNLIGGISDGDASGNLVVHSAGAGLVIAGDGNAVRANRVGITGSGSLRPNGGAGIVVSGTGNIVGGTQLEARNHVAGNALGIQLGDLGPALDSQVVGNHVHQNLGTGIRVQSGTGNLVDRNSVYSNGTSGLGDGLRLDGAGTVVSRNLIGLAGGNNGEGIFVAAAASATVIGPDNVIGNNRSGVKSEAAGTTVEGNVIGSPGNGNAFEGVWLVYGNASTVESNAIDGNGGHGIRVETDGNQLLANWIGVDEGNGNAGVFLRPAASDNLLVDNVIGNNLDGVLVQGPANRIEDNFIGVLPDGGDAGNLRFGVHAESGASGVLVFGNRIEGNASSGVVVSANGAHLCGNRIGGTLGASGEPAGHGNGGNGISVVGASDVKIGDGCAAGNLVALSGGEGVRMDGTTNTFVAYNRIASNTLGGVGLFGETNRSWIEFNTIDGNALEGIFVGTGGDDERNRFRGNSMRGNGSGIDLAGDGPSANDAGDADEGPNRLQNTPVLLFNAAVGDSGLEVGYSVDSDPAHAAYPLRVEVFAGDGASATIPSHEGASALGSGTYAAPGVATVTVARPPAGSRWLLATATDADGNTSEFSAALPWVDASEAPTLVFRSGFESEAPPSAPAALRRRRR